MIRARRATSTITWWGWGRSPSAWSGCRETDGRLLAGGGAGRLRHPGRGLRAADVRVHADGAAGGGVARRAGGHRARGRAGGPGRDGAVGALLPRADRLPAAEPSARLFALGDGDDHGARFPGRE